MKNKLTDIFKLHDVFDFAGSGDAPQPTNIEELQAQIDTLDKQLQKTKQTLLSIITTVKDNSKAETISLVRLVNTLQKDLETQKNEFSKLRSEQIRQKDRINWISINMVAMVIALFTIMFH